MSKPLLPSEKEVIQAQLKSEKDILKELEKHYQEALKGIEARIAELLGRSDANLPHMIRRIEYQRMILAQVKAQLDVLHAKEYESISDYLNNSYTDAFVGTVYTLHKQGMPVIVPIDQSVAVKAVTIDSKLKSDLYTSLGIDLTQLKKTIAAEITRGIASGMLYSDMIRNIKNAGGVPLSRARTIVRTEAGRVQEQATMDAAKKAQKAGANVVKQWSAILDGKTRDSHRRLDGQIRELDEPFTIGKRKAMHPHDFGVAEEDINCRCTMLTRARAALDADELKRLRENAVRHSLYMDDPKAFRDEKLPALKNFTEFKKAYLKAAQTIENTGKSGIIKTDKQFGKKIGKHAMDYGLDPGKQEDRERMQVIIDDICSSADAVAHGDWRGQPEPVKFYIKGEDVVITTEDDVFITILKGGTSNARVKNARRE